MLLIALSVVSVEAFCGFILTSRHARWLGTSLLQLQRDYYVGVDQNLMSFSRDCARYDKEVTYVLKPPGCRFANREYDTQVSVNSAGVRDSESALKSPEIIFLGDSVTTGWGVQDNESFPVLVGKSLGRKVLNAAVPSYATGRELAILKRFDAGSTKAIVLQYNENDAGENAEYISTGFRLSPMPESEFERVTTLLTDRRLYWFGKNISMLYRLLTDRQSFRWEFKPAGLSESEELKNFATILCHHKDLFRDKKLIVLTVTRKGYYASHFDEAVARFIARDADCQATLNMEVIDFSETLDDSDYFTIDDHLSSKGHREVAGQLAPLLEHTLTPH